VEAFKALIASRPQQKKSNDYPTIIATLEHQSIPTEQLFIPL